MYYEYVFFNETLCGRFLASLAEQGQDCEQKREGGNISVFVDEDIDDDRMDRLEALYDELMDEQRRIQIDSELQEEDAIHRVGVQYTDADGEVAQVHLDPEVVARIMREIGLDELQALVQSVASQVLAGGSSPMCKK